MNYKKNYINSVITLWLRVLYVGLVIVLKIKVTANPIKVSIKTADSSN